MKYSKAEAEKLARQIKNKLGLKIRRATEGSEVPEGFLAGLIAVESNGRETATRFEPHVFTKLEQVRDGSLAQYNKIRQSQLEGASDDALRNLATSFGATQIMGWWSIHLGITVGELRDPEKHLNHAVRLLRMNAAQYIRARDWASVLRIWNTGRPNGKTHDPHYVHNATAVMDRYELLEELAALKEPEPAALEVELVKAPDPPPVQTVASEPPVTEIKKQGPSLKEKISAATAAAGPVLGAAGIKLGGIEISAGGVYAIAAVIIVGIIVGAILYDRAEARALERARLNVNTLADPNKGNVVAP